MHACGCARAHAPLQHGMASSSTNYGSRRTAAAPPILITAAAAGPAAAAAAAEQQQQGQKPPTQPHVRVAVALEQRRRVLDVEVLKLGVCEGLVRQRHACSHAARRTQHDTRSTSHAARHTQHVAGSTSQAARRTQRSGGAVARSATCIPAQPAGRPTHPPAARRAASGP